MDTLRQATLSVAGPWLSRDLQALASAAGFRQASAVVLFSCPLSAINARSVAPLSVVSFWSAAVIVLLGCITVGTIWKSERPRLRSGAPL
jgi:hypothetical protein